MASERKPITRQRSKWNRITTTHMGGVPGAAWQRHVHDGQLRAIVAEEPDGWHLSISHVDHRDDPTRYPTWDEIAHARDELLPTELGFVMHLPPAGQYVACHPTTFHLHEHPPREAHHGQ